MNETVRQYAAIGFGASYHAGTGRRADASQFLQTTGLAGGWIELADPGDPEHRPVGRLPVDEQVLGQVRHALAMGFTPVVTVKLGIPSAPAPAERALASGAFH